MGGVVEGTITDAASGLPIAGVEVWISDAAGVSVADAWTDSAGRYGVSGLDPGSFFAHTVNWSGYLDELYDDLPCVGGCDATAGTPIVVTGGAATTSIDFALASQVCDPPNLVVAFPPTGDSQSYVDGCFVQLNGGVGPSAPGCYQVERVEWDWGDGTVEDSWFPAGHTYLPNGTAATVVATAYDTEGVTSTESGVVDLSGCVPPGPPSDLNLNAMTVDTIATFAACNSISASDFVIVAPAGDVTFQAGAAVTLGEGFMVEEGCLFEAHLGPPEGCD